MDILLKTTLQGHQNQVFALEIGEDNTLFSGGNDRGVVEWDLVEMKFKRILCAVSHPVYALHGIPNTTLLAIGLRSGEVLVVDYVTQTLKAKLKLDKGAVFALKTFASKPELIAIGEEGVAYIFDTNSFELLYRFKISPTTIRTIAIDDTEQYVYFGDKGGVIYQYDSSDYHLVHQSQVHQMPVTSMVVYGDMLLTGGRDAKMYKLNKLNLHTVQEITPHMFTVYNIVKQPSGGELIATASRDKTWKIWHPDKLALIKNVSLDRGYDSHYLSINTMLWHKDYIFTAGDDKMIKAWLFE